MMPFTDEVGTNRRGHRCEERLQDVANRHRAKDDMTDSSLPFFLPSSLSFLFSSSERDEACEVEMVLYKMHGRCERIIF